MPGRSGINLIGCKDLASVCICKRCSAYTDNAHSDACSDLFLGDKAVCAKSHHKGVAHKHTVIKVAFIYLCTFGNGVNVGSRCSFTHRLRFCFCFRNGL